MPFIHDRDLLEREVLRIEKDDDIEFKTEVDQWTNVVLISNTGSVTLERNNDGNGILEVVAMDDIFFKGEFNGDSTAILTSRNGRVRLAGEGDSNKNVNSQAVVKIDASVSASMKGDLNSHGNLIACVRSGTFELNGNINSHSRLSVIAEGDISINGDINANTSVELVSTRGAINLNGHIHSETNVSLAATGDIVVEGNVNGNLSLRARSSGNITLKEDISNHALVILQAGAGIRLSGNVSGNSVVKLTSSSESITIDGDVNGDALVYYWPGSSLVFADMGNNYIREEEWSAKLPSPRPEEITGHWWRNWFWSYGFVSGQIRNPANYRDLLEIMGELDGDFHVKAIGGGWSFSDIALPLEADQVNTVSIFERGRKGSADLREVLRHMEEKDTPIDLYPDQVSRSLDHSTSYDQDSLAMRTNSGIDLPAIDDQCIQVDVRNLKSSLQHQLDHSPYYDDDGNRVHLFWVEAGITMAELNKLLDHQVPRLAIQASGGSPGATLAGTLSTATHGGEFKDPLLVDRVKAVHLITQGGMQWWIEGEKSVLDASKLQELMYGDIKIIRHGTRLPNGLTAEDILKTVVVSLGAFGIIYSVVLEVVEQFSIQQVTKKYRDWRSLLDTVGVTEEQLRNKEATANQAMYEFLMDGDRNGTGISFTDNRYVDLAVSPLAQGCWIVNRRFLEGVVSDPNDAGDLMGNYLSSVSRAMTAGAERAEVGGQMAGRILDFLSLPRDIPGLLALGLFESAVFTRFLNGVTRSPNLLSSLMAHLQTKAHWNKVHELDPSRSTGFMADVLEGVLDALQATSIESVSDVSGLSFEVGAIGWPGDGIPGRGYEAALPADFGFSYMQSLIDVITRFKDANKLFMGYISTRICPQTKTLIGMQQFDRSIMVEVVAHRTPQANEIFDALIDGTKRFRLSRSQPVSHVVPESDYLHPLFHWGLETERFDRAYLDSTVLGRPYRPGASLTRLNVFENVRDILLDGRRSVFQNAFTERMGL